MPNIQFIQLRYSFITVSKLPFRWNNSYAVKPYTFIYVYVVFCSLR